MVDMSRIDFTGKTLLLTGSNGGIGRETAIQFRAAGANVVMGEHTVDLDHDFATTLDPTGEHVLSFHLEAGASASNDAFVAQISNRINLVRALFIGHFFCPFGEMSAHIDSRPLRLLP